jgi:hypothetical protein
VNCFVVWIVYLIVFFGLAVEEGGGIDLALSVRLPGSSVDTDCSPNCSTSLMSLIETELVLCEVGLEFLYIIYMHFGLEKVNVNNSL